MRIPCDTHSFGPSLRKLILATALFAELTSPAFAQLSVSDLAGRWRIVSSGYTGCGHVSMLLDVTLLEDGTSSNGVLTQHGQFCDSTHTGQTFIIKSLSPDGTGTANMGCGPGCGWELDIQVSRDRQIFNLVDVATVNPGNYISGVAVKR